MKKAKNSKKTWSPDDDDLLEDKWGNWTIKTLSERLGRTEKAILHRVSFLGLGSSLTHDECLTASEIARILNMNKSTICKWINKKGLKSVKKALIKQPVHRVKLKDLLDWLEKNQDCWNASQVEEFGLGLEPDWLREKRRKDMNKKPSRMKYEKTEDDKLVRMHIMGCTLKEISNELGRTQKSVSNRLEVLRKMGRKIPYKNPKNHLKQAG